MILIKYTKIIIILFVLEYIFWLTLDIILWCIYEVVCWHWYIRKIYQSSIYRFNAYHDWNLWLKHFWPVYYRFHRPRINFYTYATHFYHYNMYLLLKEWWIKFHWYIFGFISWFTWSCAIYFSNKYRDLGPSYEWFAYSDEIDMGWYKTIGIRMYTVWVIWTYSWYAATINFIHWYLHKLIISWSYKLHKWTRTFYSCIDMVLLTLIRSFYRTTTYIWENYSYLVELDNFVTREARTEQMLAITEKFIDSNSKGLLLWFPWQSFFSYITIFGLLYMFTLLAIYNTDNNYYIVLYTIFVMFLFAANLVMLDLDIFAGLLLMIESVVILMLFFLIIYLSPNVAMNYKNQKWKVYVTLSIAVMLLSTFSYMNLGLSWFQPFSVGSRFLDNYYEALNELFVNDLMGVYINMYITNSLLLVIIGFLLLIASIICVVIVSFFTKLRNYSFKNFLNLFSILKTCYSYIFLRKQNLSKQGRSSASTRIFNKKTFDTAAHTEYKEKYEMYEKQKKEAQEKAEQTKQD